MSIARTVDEARGNTLQSLPPIAATAAILPVTSYRLHISATTNTIHPTQGTVKPYLQTLPPARKTPILILSTVLSLSRPLPSTMRSHILLPSVLLFALGGPHLHIRHSKRTALRALPRLQPIQRPAPAPGFLPTSLRHLRLHRRQPPPSHLHRSMSALRHPHGVSSLGNSVGFSMRGQRVFGIACGGVERAEIQRRRSG